MCLRKKFDQLCFLLQSLLETPITDVHISPNQINLLTELILAYPSPQQRLTNPYALDSWNLEVGSRLKVENTKAWDARLVDLISCIQGHELTQSVINLLSDWQEILYSSINKPVELKVTVEALINERPPNPLNHIYLAIFNGDLNRLASISDIDLIGPHYLNLLSFLPRLNFFAASSSCLLILAEKLFKTSFWNLAVDYMWVTSQEGRENLEKQLFSLAFDGSYNRQLSVINVCKNFQLDILADTIHVMIAEAEMKQGRLSKALHHALCAQQDFLVTRICDVALNQYLNSHNITFLEIADYDAVQTSFYPRLHLLSKIHQVQMLMSQEDRINALSVLQNVIKTDLLYTPDFIKPFLLSLFINCSSAGTVISRDVLNSLYGLVNDYSGLLSDEDVRNARILLNRQYSLSLVQ